MRLEFVYLAYSEVTGENQEFSTKKDAENFIKSMRKEDKIKNINRRWKWVREERYYE